MAELNGVPKKNLYASNMIEEAWSTGPIAKIESIDPMYSH